MNVRVAGVYRRKHAILTLKYHYPDGDVYALPGGGVEDHESCEAALQREFVEEVGMTIFGPQLLYTGDMMGDGKRKRTLHMVFIVDGEAGQQPELNRAETSANKCVWLPESQLAEVLLYPDIGKALSVDLAAPLHARHLGNCMKRKWA